MGVCAGCGRSTCARIKTLAWSRQVSPTALMAAVPTLHKDCHSRNLHRRTPPPYAYQRTLSRRCSSRSRADTLQSQSMTSYYTMQYWTGTRIWMAVLVRLMMPLLQRCRGSTCRPLRAASLSSTTGSHTAASKTDPQKRAGQPSCSSTRAEKETNTRRMPRRRPPQERRTGRRSTTLTQTWR